MRNAAEVKTAADIREIFGLAAGGEAVAVEKEKNKKNLDRAAGNWLY